MLIDSHMNPRWADFGLSALHGAISVSLRGDSNAAGSPRFMAPERLIGEGDNTRVSFASDIYAFAGVCVEVGFHDFYPILP